MTRSSGDSVDEPPARVARACVADELTALCDPIAVLESIAAHTDHAIMAADLDGIVLLWNRAAEHLSGWPADEALGGQLGEILTGTRESALGRLRSLAAAETPSERQVQVRRKDGSVARVSITLAPLKDTQGHTCGVLAVAHGLAEDERFDRMRRDFTDLAAAELRAPLTAVLGYAQLLTASEVLEDPEERRRIVRMLEERCTDLTDLLEDVVMLSGLAEREAAPTDEVFDACEVAARVVGRAEARYPGRDLECAAPPRPVFVSVDRLRFEQVLAALLSAVLDDSPSSRVTIAVGVSDGSAQLKIGAPGVEGPSRTSPGDGAPRTDASRAPGVPAFRNGVRLRFAERFTDLYSGSVSAAFDAAEGSRFVLELPTSAAERTA